MSDEEDAISERIQLHKVKKSENGQVHVHQDQADRHRCVRGSDAGQEDRY